MRKCRRVYRNGDSVLEERADPQGWLAFNSEHRWGCALLVDGEMKQRGYYRDAERAALEERFASDKPVPVQAGRTS